MGAVQRDRWYLMVLLFLPFLRVAFPQKAPITVPLDEGMVLDCLCPWQGTFGMVSWTKPPKKDAIAVFHPEHGTTFSHSYRERIDFLRSSPMDGSISLRNVTHQDIGLYVCSIQTFPEGSWRKSFQVEDLDEPPEEGDDSSETQGAIQADTELVAEQHGNATIACDLRNVAMASKVTLDRRASPEQPWGVVGVCRMSRGGPVAQNTSHRGKLICTRGLDLRLHLTDVGPQDAGLYRCKWSEGGAAQNTTVMLRVQPAGGFSLSAYMMYIYIGAGGAAFILLLTVVVVVVVLATRRKRRRTRVEYRVKLHSQRPIHNFYENVSVCPRRKPKQSKECPIYVNLLTVPSQRFQR